MLNRKCHSWLLFILHILPYVLIALCCVSDRSDLVYSLANMPLFSSSILTDPVTSLLTEHLGLTSSSAAILSGMLSYHAIVLLCDIVYCVILLPVRMLWKFARKESN